MRICLVTPNTLSYPDGGHVWVFLNWALGFRALGHEVIWLDVLGPNDTDEQVARWLEVLRARLAPLGLDQSIALCTSAGEALPQESALRLRSLDEAIACDLLCDHRYDTPHRLVNAFRRSILVDIDPGQFQIALVLNTYDVAPHTTYFTVGEWTKFQDVVKPMFSTLGREWLYIPPPVSLEHWPVTDPARDSAMSTVSSWYKANEWMLGEDGKWYDNCKRVAFQDYLNVPTQVPLPLELCINIGTYQPEIDLLESLGWRVRNSTTVSDPYEYQRYIQQSLGEFSCCKPSYARMQTGWLSDRTACYLASGKPAVVQKTGRSDIFPDDRGILRFTTPQQAVQMLEDVHRNYATHARAARQIAEAHLDARKVLARVLEASL